MQNNATGSDSREIREERRARAIDLFAGYLEEHDDQLDDFSFAQLLDEHPDVREELLRAQFGLRVLRSQSGVMQHAFKSVRRRRIARRVAAAVACAVILVASTLLFRPYWSSWKLRPAAAPLSQAPISAELAKVGARVLLSAIENQDPPELSAGFLPTAKTPAPDPLQLERVADAGTRVVAMYSVIQAVADTQPAEVKREVEAKLSEVKASLGKAAPGSWGRAALDGINAGKGPIQLEKAGSLLLALRSDPMIGPMVDAAPADSFADRATASLVARIAAKAFFHVRAIDLDARGIELPDAEVYAQPVSLTDGTIGSAARIGSTRSEVLFLEPGDWRITVVDGKSKDARHAQLRILAPPGEDLGVRVAFLRNTDAVLAGMADRPEATIRFGAPSDAPPNDLDLPETICKVDETWFDPFEVSCSDYSVFYRDVVRHPEWFDGHVPVHRPRVLSGDGSCPDALAHRPIVDVNWDEATLYANWAGKRLPTEREWERVARGSENENRWYPWGRDFDARLIDASASMTKTVGELIDSVPKGAPIRVKAPPFYELLAKGAVDQPEYRDSATPPEDGDPVYRLADNIAELTEDLYCDSSGNNQLAGSNFLRVLRGGSWMFAGEANARTWIREPITTVVGSSFFGFRCVKTRSPGFASK